MAELSADVHALSGAYAIGAVDDDERAAFEEHLRACSACTVETRELRETLVRLAESSAVSAPAGLKPAVMQRVPGTRQEPVAAAALPPVQIRRRVASRAPWLVAAALAVVTGVAVGVAVHEHGNAVAGGRLAALLSDPRARHISGPAVGGGTVVLVREGDQAVVVAADLPALARGLAYQLWIVRPSGVSSAGLGPAGTAGATPWARPVGGVRSGDVVAVSVEPSSGSTQPTTVPVVTLTA